MDFTQAVNKWIKENDSNPTEVARLMNYSPQYIINILNGDRRWNETTIKKACEVLGLRVFVVNARDGVSR
ncbi:helix-turn-helix domain-containing protein [Paenibacillus sp. NPDC058177]|uniref:helix-turn-helix domain-containing protein n=1 Tax=Paenibacillus sp. NPDC058177 TaxID=3346369 RepID=UPI0036DAA700